MRAALIVLGLLLASESQAKVHTRTTHVEALLLHRGQLHVATRGGLEVYAGDRRVALYTSDDGLADNHVRALSLDGDVVIAHTATGRCRLGASITCTPATLPPPAPAASPRFAGFRETTRLGEYVGTAGGGVWRGERRLTPEGQICSNHITAIEPFAGTVYFASFDEGLCRREADGSFRRVGEELRMVNDLLATPAGLFVAASEGLFVSQDGEHFTRIGDERGFNDLATDRGFVYATTPGSLWRVRLADGRVRTTWKPGGARSLQAVAARGGRVVLASEDRGVIVLDRRGQATLLDRAAGLPSSWVLDVALVGEDILAATLRDGLVRIAADGSIHRLLPGSWLLHVSVDRGTIWLGSQAGAFRVRDAEVERLGQEPHPNVHVVRRIGRTLYLGSEGGLAELPVS